MGTLAREEGLKTRDFVFASTSTMALSKTLPGPQVTIPDAPPPPPSKPASDVLAGATARAASQATIHPLDTLKVRMQANALKKHGRIPTLPRRMHRPRRIGLSNVFGVAASAGKNIAGLYRGVLGAASGAGIAIGAYFAFYTAATNLIARSGKLPPGGVAFVSGAIAAGGSSIVKVPLAVCIRSVQAGVYSNVFVAAQSIVRTAGPLGLFAGYVPTLVEDVPDMAFKFAGYETIRSIHRTMLKDREPTAQEDFAMGAIAGAFAAAATTPLDVIKTHMMCTAASRPTMVSAAKAIIASEGLKGFIRGVGPRAASNGINSAVFFTFFEAFRGIMAQHAKSIEFGTNEVAAKVDEKTGDAWYN